MMQGKTFKGVGSLNYIPLTSGTEPFYELKNGKKIDKGLTKG
jgi:hypothetical protein